MRPVRNCHNANNLDFKCVCGGGGEMGRNRGKQFTFTEIFAGEQQKNK